MNKLHHHILIFLSTNKSSFEEVKFLCNTNILRNVQKGNREKFSLPCNIKSHKSKLYIFCHLVSVCMFDNITMCDELYFENYFPSLLCYCMSSNIKNSLKWFFLWFQRKQTWKEFMMEGMLPFWWDWIVFISYFDLFKFKVDCITIMHVFYDITQFL